MKVKTIGVILRQWTANVRDIPLYAVKDEVVGYLRRYDVNVICIPINFDNEDEFAKIKRIIDFCDGIIFPGGEGINKIDSEIMQYLYKIDKPTLGLCLGMQIMGNAFEGKVESGGAIKIGHHDEPNKEYVHIVNIEKDSKLYEILGKTQIKVNSRHTDCVRHTKLSCVAKSNKGVIEAIEDKNKRFFIGVQWHPETISEDEYSKKLFDSFINSL